LHQKTAIISKIVKLWIITDAVNVNLHIFWTRISTASFNIISSSTKTVKSLTTPLIVLIVNQINYFTLQVLKTITVWEEQENVKFKVTISKTAH